MSNGDLLKQLFRKYKSQDSGGFELIAQQIIDEERQKNHHLLANDLERILANGVAQPRLNGHTKNLPRDHEGNVSLVEIRHPSKVWSDVILSEENSAVLERVMLEVRRRELLETYDMKPSTRLLFCGPPGCGKTLSAEILASELGLPLLYTRFDSIISSYLGQTAANLRKVFDFALSGTWVIFFDEFDAIGKSRDDLSEHGELKRVVNSFLQLLDSFSASSLVIAATNHEGQLDSALWRRFDEIVYFDRPTRGQILEIINRKLSAVRHRQLQISETLLDQLVGYSHADLERICADAIKIALLKQENEIDNCEFETALSWQQRRTKIAKNVTK